MEAIDKKVNQQLPEPLSTRVVRGGLWVLGFRVTNRVLRLARTIILARLLVPQDFGLFGIALLSIMTLETFSGAGFEIALVQKKENVESYLDTAWTVSAIRGTILFLILFLAAPLIAKFFDSPKASLVIRVIALYTLLSGFRNIAILFFQKELEFNKEFFYELSATLADLTVAISLAFILRNVWALVYGGLAGNFVRLFMSYLLHPYRPRIKFEKEKFQDLFDFGKWLLGSGILVFLITQGDDIFVGKMLGVTALGFYQMAYLISNLPATEITQVISKVTFPAYSKLQHDLHKLRAAYLEVLQFTTFLSVPVAGLLFLLAPDFTRIFMGEKWLPMVPAMKVLALWGMIRSVGATTGPVFVSIGKPQILTKMLLLAVILLALLIYPLSIKWGILGTSIAVVVAISIPTLLAAHMLIKVLNCKIYQFYVRIFFPLLSFLLPFLLFFIINRLYIIKYNLLTLSFIICMMIITYMCISYLLDKYSNYGITSTLKELIINIKS